MSEKGKLKNRIYIATMCGHWKEIADKYGVGIELDYFCQAQNMDGDRGEKVKAEVAKIVTEKDAKVLHGPFNELFPAAIDPLARELAMKRLTQAAEICHEFNIKKMVVHSGYVPFNYFKVWHVDRSVEFWKEFMDRQPEDFEICIENVLDDEPYMMAEMAERIGDPRVGLCYDVGHANIKGKNGFTNNGRPETTDQDEWLKVMAPYLKHLHIHNNYGAGDTHNGFDEGSLDIERILNGVIERCGEETTITAELIAGEGSFEWLREKGFI